MGDSQISADGGQPDRADRIEGIAAGIEELGPLIRELAAGEAANGEIQLPDDAPSPEGYDSHAAHLRAAHAWAIDEFLDAVSDLEHRTLELQQAVEVYPGVGDDRADSVTHRDVVRNDLADVAGAVDRLVRAGAQLKRIEEAYDET